MLFPEREHRRVVCRDNSPPSRFLTGQDKPSVEYLPPTSAGLVAASAKKILDEHAPSKLESRVPLDFREQPAERVHDVGYPAQGAFLNLDFQRSVKAFLCPSSLSSAEVTQLLLAYKCGTC